MKQLTVFLENREGSLNDALSTLSENKINIISLSLAETTDYGLLRLIVSNPAEAKDILKAEGFSAHLSDVVAVKLPHVAGSLHSAIKVLSDKNINIEYMYALCTKTDEAAIVIKPADIESANTELGKAGFEFFTDGDTF